LRPFLHGLYGRCLHCPAAVYACCCASTTSVMQKCWQHTWPPAHAANHLLYTRVMVSSC
jgi:hypothetical protein